MLNFEADNIVLIAKLDWFQCPTGLGFKYESEVWTEGIYNIVYLYFGAVVETLFTEGWSRP